MPKDASGPAVDGHQSPADPSHDPSRHVVVLGAGLAAASRLARSGVRVTVLEAAEHVGGLAGSFTRKTEWGEFDYDNGPHRFHTGEKHLNDEVLRLLGDNVCTANRQSRIVGTARPRRQSMGEPPERQRVRTLGFEQPKHMLRDGIGGHSGLT